MFGTNLKLRCQCQRTFWHLLCLILSEQTRPIKISNTIPFISRSGQDHRQLNKRSKFEPSFTIRNSLTESLIRLDTREFWDLKCSSSLKHISIFLSRCRSWTHSPYLISPCMQFFLLFYFFFFLIQRKTNFYFFFPFFQTKS